MTKPAIERDEQGNGWVRCSAASPCREKSVVVDGERCNVYHPDAKVIGEDGSSGWDEHCKCPHCGLDWWIECDG